MSKRSRPRLAAASRPKTGARITPGPPLVTISIPVYNEAENIAELLKRLRGAVDAHSQRYAFEFLFTDDGSVDSTYDLLMHEARQDHRIRVLKLSRSFGFQQNVLINFLHARGNAAIEIDADLQDPPGLIGEFLAMWEKGLQGCLWSSYNAQRRGCNTISAQGGLPADHQSERGEGADGRW